jgi:hypothetical protein
LEEFNRNIVGKIEVIAEFIGKQSMIDSIIQNEIKIQNKIQTAFEEMGTTRSASYDIAFHMTDWIADVKELLETYSNIEKLSNDEITGFVFKFLAHVPNHLNAAMKLSGIGKVEDVFKVNIFEDDYE